jgi:hypothetical protein
MKRDRAMEELRALVLVNNPSVTAAELETLTDLQVLELVRNSIMWDEREGPKNELELQEMRAFLDHLIQEHRSKLIQR